MKSFKTISALARSSTDSVLVSSGSAFAVGGAAFALLFGLTFNSSTHSTLVAYRFVDGVGRIGSGVKHMLQHVFFSAKEQLHLSKWIVPFRDC